jgi:hypothetical protein
MNLVSPGKLYDDDFHIVFGKVVWKILKSSLIVEKGNKIGIP